MLNNHQFGDLMPKLEKRHGDDFSDVVQMLALSTPDNPVGEDTDPTGLSISRGRIPVSELPNYGMTDDDVRVREAHQGYRTNPSAVPPILVVRRAGSYEIADGSHRTHAARLLGKEHIPAWVVHSPHKDLAPFNED